MNQTILARSRDGMLVLFEDGALQETTTGRVRAKLEPARIGQSMNEKRSDGLFSPDGARLALARE